MLVHSRKSRQNHGLFSLKLKNQVSEKVNSYKHLGIIFDSELSWIPLIKAITSKLASVCGVDCCSHYLDM